ncbi:MAG: hypothetical protein ACJ8ER_13695 [Allosphingosinicella sp.]
MLTGLFALAVATARLYPDLPIGRLLHTWLVDLPLRLAASVERKHLICLVVLLVAGQALLMAAPLDLAFLAAWDLSIYVDLMLAAWTIATVARGRAAWTFVRTKAVRLARPGTKAGRGRAAGRAPRTRRPPVPTNDADDEGRPFRQAA